MIKGYIENNTGRYKHIFKRGLFPGMTVSLEDLYVMYGYCYKGEFDLDFVKWLDENKAPKGFDIVIEKYDELKYSDEGTERKISDTADTEVADSYIPPEKMTSKQLADLKIKDNPKQVIEEVSSVHKLRRALSMCKDRKGKATLIKLIKERIAELS